MISVIIPVFNERDNINKLAKELNEVSKTIPITEIIFIDDASTDGSIEVLVEIKKIMFNTRVLHHKKRLGQSAALFTGINSAKNKIIVTLDGDGQNPPNDIKILWNSYINYKKDNTYEDFLILGQRLKRMDSFIKKFTSKIANNIRSFFLNDKTKDTGCSLKLFPKDLFLRLPYFNHMHRFLPALMLRASANIIPVEVSHRKREFGMSKYGTINRAIVGIVDLFGVFWLMKRSIKVKEKYFEEI